MGVYYYKVYWEDCGENGTFFNSIATSQKPTEYTPLFFFQKDMHYAVYNLQSKKVIKEGTGN